MNCVNRLIASLRPYRILKNLIRLPACLTLCLILYISNTNLKHYLPSKYPDKSSFNFVFFSSVQLYLSIMTVAFLMATFCTKPGYIPAKYFRPKEGGDGVRKVPRELRLFRMENYIRNGLFDFEKDMAGPDFPTMESNRSLPALDSPDQISS